jgi:HAD superfamily hydrolase (TIGR01549 family)
VGGGADIRAVIFDLDGTLYEWPRLLKTRVALSLWTDLHILRHVSASREAVRGLGFEDGEALDRAFIAELSRRAGLSPAAAGRWYELRFIHSFITQLGRHCRPREGVMDLLEHLHRRGLRLGVLSDYEMVAERLEAVRVPVTSFDLLMSAGESGALKPSPRPFLLAARRLGVDPPEVIVVGDRDDMDGAGARAARMTFHHLVDRTPTVESLLGRAGVDGS